MTINMVKRIVASVALGLTVAAGSVGLFAFSLRYVAPAHQVAAPTATPLKPIIEGGYIKVPFEIFRDRECLAQSTVTLRRMYDYGPGYGVFEDVRLLGLYNTTITGLGLHRVMLWFPLPSGITGDWDYASKIEDDCGGWWQVEPRHPRETRIPVIIHIPGGAS